jgi:hypothetical protein
MIKIARGSALRRCIAPWRASRALATAPSSFAEEAVRLREHEGFARWMTSPTPMYTAARARPRPGSACDAAFPLMMPERARRYAAGHHLGQRPS